ncbi:preprotein translocase subunit SecG [Patescibacteria group bacterium]|nr:preprotein translocase subunit SecG [Patescibacteria group bacterium]
MNIVLSVIQIVVSLGLITLILLQSSKGGLGGGLGGGELYRTKRGAEKIVFTSTIVLSVLFLVTSIISVLLR